MNPILIFILGTVFGGLIVFLFYLLRKSDARIVAQELLQRAEEEKRQEIEKLMNSMREAFGSLSFDALQKNADVFLQLAGETLSRQTQLGEKELESKKQLIDRTVQEMRTDLQRVQQIMTTLEKDREQKFGELTKQLMHTAEQTGKLQDTAHQLRQALASTKARGQWGERMAEDVLRFAGFVEGINYLKNKTLQTVANRPDYTFLLPQDLKVNMDVKFPLDNYLRYLETTGESDREQYKGKFVRDVRARIKEVTTRDYINPSENTVDYVIVFIPNEQVYGFINENDPSVLDEALRNKVILCSPLTLYAILAVIRQAVDNFNLEKTASHMLSLFGAFTRQWDMFIRSFEKMGKKIEEAQNEFHHLTTTRRNQLERPIRQIEDLRTQKGITEAQLTAPQPDNEDET
jgi:DNA recombination protein RmuC